MIYMGGFSDKGIRVATAHSQKSGRWSLHLFHRQGVSTSLVCSMRAALSAIKSAGATIVICAPEHNAQEFFAEVENALTP